jgi:hypothetical protein
METVLKTVLVFMASVGSNPTPSAKLKLDWRREHHAELPQNGGSFLRYCQHVSDREFQRLTEVIPFWFHGPQCCRCQVFSAR